MVDTYINSISLSFLISVVYVCGSRPPIIQLIHIIYPFSSLITVTVTEL